MVKRLLLRRNHLLCFALTNNFLTQRLFQRIKSDGRLISAVFFIYVRITTYSIKFFKQIYMDRSTARLLSNKVIFSSGAISVDTSAKTRSSFSNSLYESFSFNASNFSTFGTFLTPFLDTNGTKLLTLGAFPVTYFLPPILIK